MGHGTGASRHELELIWCANTDRKSKIKNSSPLALPFAHLPTALKGRHTPRNDGHRVGTNEGFALTGLARFLVLDPRAVPWAISLRPVGTYSPQSQIKAEVTRIFTNART